METILNVISAATLLFFCYGTWRIDQKLTRTNELLERNNELLSEINDNNGGFR